MVITEEKNWWFCKCKNGVLFVFAGNSFTDKGIELLKASVQDNKVITTLVLKNGNVINREESRPKDEDEDEDSR